MRIPRTRGAVSGVLLMILGAWGALIPFIGPYFDLTIGSDDTWDWSSGRFWLFVVPGVVAFAGGFLLVSSAHRARAAIGAWMATAAGVWFVVGSTVSMLWNDGVSAAGTPAGSSDQQVLELLAMLYGLGALITALGAFALGRLAIRSARDVELDREAELEREREARVDDDRDRIGAPVAGSRASDRDEAYDRDAPVTARDEAYDRDAPVADRDETIHRETPTGDRDVTFDRERVGDRPADMGASPATPPTSSAATSTRRGRGLLGRLRGH